MAVPNTPDILGFGAIVSLLPLGFLLRLAFWLGIVILLLPPAPSQQFKLPPHGTLTADDLAVPWRGVRQKPGP
jgi:hypothetical protein